MNLTGYCLCGQLQYRVTGPLGLVVNCHCSFCRRVHGSPFTTVAFIPASAFAWEPASEHPAEYITGMGHKRTYCAACSTPICNFAADGGDFASLVVGSLANEFQVAPWFHINTESKSPWFEFSDELPRFDKWPSGAELVDFARKHETRLPAGFLAAAD